MKQFFVSLGLVALLSPLAGSADDVVHDVATLLEEHQHDEALALVDRIASSQYAPMIKASVLYRAAQFLEQDAGAFQRALATYERVLALELPSETPVVESARDAARRLRDLLQKHRQVYAALAEIAQAPATKQNAPGIITTLQSLAAGDPEFPEQDTIRYYLGLYLFLDEQYGESYKELRYAATHHATPVVKLPHLPRLLNQAHEKWLWASAKTAAWSVIGGFLLITAVLFFAAQPWRWVGIRQWVFLIILVLVWWVVFTLASRWIGAHAQEAITQTQTGDTHRFSRFGNPASEAFTALFRYGLVGTLGIGLLAIATARCRLRVTVVAANTVAAILLFASLMVVFYDRYGTQGTLSLLPKNSSLRDYLQLTVSYTTDEIEPFMLTNPTAFPHLAISNIHDPKMQEWMMRYLPRTLGESTHHDSS